MLYPIWNANGISLVELDDIGETKELDVFDLLLVWVQLDHKVFHSKVTIHHSNIRQLLNELANCFYHVCKVLFTIFMVEQFEKGRVFNHIRLNYLLWVERDIPQ